MNKCCGSSGFPHCATLSCFVVLCVVVFVIVTVMASHVRQSIAMVLEQLIADQTNDNVRVGCNGHGDE
jgi:hypothetical protein